MYRQLMHFPKETKVAIYNRVSTEKRAQVEAIEHQVEESKKIVLQEGLCLVRQYVEMETATSAERRIQYRQMIEDLENDVFDLLVVKSQDRIMRDQAEWHLLKRTLHKHRKNLYFYMEDEVFNQRENGLKHDVQAMLDEYESERKSEKAIHSHRRRQMCYEGQACLNITRPIYGWDRLVTYTETGRKEISFLVNEEEKENILEVCRKIEEGDGFSKIAEHMYQRGVRSKPTKGTRPQEPKKISATGWKKIITSPLLRGDAVLHTRQTDFYTKQRVKIPENEWIYRENVITPLMTREYHMRILGILSDRKKSL